MKQFYQLVTKQILLQGICLIVLGLAIMFIPGAIFDLAVIIISVYLCINGILLIVDSQKLKKEEEKYTSSIVLGILSLLAAAFIAFFAKTLIVILPILIGLFIVFNAVLNLMQGIQVQKYAAQKATILIIYSTVLLIIGLVLIFFPFQATVLLFQWIGFILLLMGVVTIVSMLILPKDPKENKGNKSSDE